MIRDEGVADEGTPMREQASIQPTGSDSPPSDRLIIAGRGIALLAAWTATGGSLYFSEVFGWLPCVLCWYQRIAMYPLAFILTVALIRGDRSVHWYVLPLSITGGAIALYHYLLIRTDWFVPPPCTGGIPCNVDYINLLGFINIPFLALIAFTIVSFGVLAPAVMLDDEPAPPPLRRDPLRLTALALAGAIIVAFAVVR
jgi:disulfide bond formation protein DsbB